MYPPSVEKLIKLFSRFPTVGPRTAARFVFYLLGQDKEKTEELIKATDELKKNTNLCPLCFNFFESDRQELCPVCADPLRDKNTVCIVEKEVDLETLEKTGKFKGVYFVLGGVFSGFDKKERKKMIESRVDKLAERIKEKKQIKEIILALNPTPEGQITVLWLKRKFEGLGVKLTQLGRGLPVGGELEYADEETLSSALESRR